MIFLILCFCIFLCTLLCERILADDSTLITEQEERSAEEEMTEQITITIHAGANLYYIEGALEVIQTGGDGHETIMEVYGSVEKAENSGEQNPYESLERTDPTVLTVYTEDDIYGFYSVYEMEKKDRSIDYYGYLVGYADGENYCST